MGGLVGQATYSDLLAEFLHLRELAHVGEGTVFGLGKYHMTDSVIASEAQQSHARDS